MKCEKVGAVWKIKHLEKADGIRAVNSSLTGNLQSTRYTVGLATVLKDIYFQDFKLADEFFTCEASIVAEV